MALAFSQPMVHMTDTQKRFGPKIALDRAELSLYQGEILGLVGDNGAGKSTLLKVLSGGLKKDAGTIFIQGQKADIDSPIQSRNLGIEMVYQDFSLCENLTVWENVFLGRCKTRPLFKSILPVLDKHKMVKKPLRF
ncbi:MAG: sugar ABC transporter ATP-binding protein [Desulfobacter sp.]|nr:sugar ABC transporter ATP-binding protein [Desulfobacter sp.]WDP85253.1 MAG: sugar ABC transporter ATP-binding protein [Desulfobacter sp.]